MITQEWIDANPEKFAAALNKKWAANPGLMQEAIQANPDAFYSASAPAPAPAPNPWETNRDHILSQVDSGNATQNQLDWYNRYMASGSPTDQGGMLTKEQWQPIMTEKLQGSAIPEAGISGTDWSTKSSYLNPDGTLRDDLTTAQLYEIQDGGIGVTSNQLPNAGDLIKQAGDRLNSGGGVKDPSKLSKYDQRYYNNYTNGHYTIPQMDQLYRTNGVRLGLPKPPGYDQRNPAGGSGLTTGGYEQATTTTTQTSGNTGNTPITDGMFSNASYGTNPGFGTLALFQNPSLGMFNK